MIRKYSRLIMVLFLSGLFLMPSLSQAKEQMDVNREIAIAIDYSASAMKDVEKYRETIEFITGCSPTASRKEKDFCGAILPEDHITIFKISGETLRNVEVIAEIYLEKKPMLQSKIKYQLRISKVKENFRDDIYKALDKPVLANNTEIMDGAKVAANWFKKSTAPEKYLIFLSDMVEESEFYNFAKIKAEAEPIVKKEMEAHRLPDLTGVKVYVSGATAKTTSKYDELKKFWLTYFLNTGAELDPMNYSNKLSSFP